MIEVDCRLCKNCSGNGCLKYGNDANKAVKECTNDRFKNYENVWKSKVRQDDKTMGMTNFEKIIKEFMQDYEQPLSAIVCCLFAGDCVKCKIFDKCIEKPKDPSNLENWLKEEVKE